MRYYAYACLALWTAACRPQPNAPNSGYADIEFGTTFNGLLYSPQTLRPLRRIVDSLNLRHQTGGPLPAYRGVVQGRAWRVNLSTGDLERAYHLLQGRMTPQRFARLFPAAELTPDQLVTGTVATRENLDGQRETTTEFRSVPLHGEFGHTLRMAGNTLGQALPSRHWLVEYQKDQGRIEAFYFPDGLSKPLLPARYARLVQYADCLIDTATQIYLPAARRTGGRFYPSGFSRSARAFLDYAHQQTNQPVDNDEDETLSDAEQVARWVTQRTAYRIWDSLRLRRMDELARSPQFRALLARAATNDSSRGTNDEEFEEYVARYYSPQKALQLKRSRMVAGYCSADEAPRRHALSIARLAAQTQHWPIFLRAHLDIMNDRFERNTDGGYAQARRHTYLRELEELDINAPNLLLGIGLQVGNAGRNHYQGDVLRLGRALAETTSPRQVEQLLLDMITDQRLDAYNRVQAYYLLLNYNYFLTDRVRQGKNLIQLNLAAHELPDYLSAKLLAQTGRASAQDKL